MPHRPHTRSSTIRVLTVVVLAVATPISADGICSRTGPIRDAILGKLPDIDDCRQVTIEHLAAIHGTLDLRRSDIESLNVGDFGGLVNLTELLIDQNQIAAIRPGTFANLSGVERLGLGDNRLTALQAGTFDGLAELKRLDLWANRVSRIEANAFNGLAELERLDLWSNALAALPAWAFGGL